MGPRPPRPRARPSRSRWSATPPRSSPPGRRPASGSTSSPTRPRRTTRSPATSRPRSRSTTRSRSARRQPDEYVRRSMRLDGGPRPGDARLPGGRRDRLRLRQQPARPGAGGGRRRRLRLPGLRAGVHPAAVLRGPRAVPVGRRCRATRPTSCAPTGRSSSCSPTTPGCAAGSRWPRRACRSRACRPGSAGSATASGRGPGSPSTSSSRTRRGLRADRHRARPPRLGLGRVTEPRDRGDARRHRRGRRLAAAQRAREHGGGRHLGVDPSRRRGRDRLLASTPAWSSSPTARSSRPRSSSGCSRRTRRWASSATSTRATSARSRSPGSAVYGYPCSITNGDRTPRSGVSLHRHRMAHQLCRPGQSVDLGSKASNRVLPRGDLDGPPPPSCGSSTHRCVPARPRHDRPRGGEQHGPAAAVHPGLDEHQSDQLRRQLVDRRACSQHPRRARNHRVSWSGHHDADGHRSADAAWRLRVRHGRRCDPEPDQHGDHQWWCGRIPDREPGGRTPGVADRGCAVPPVAPGHDRRFEHHRFVQPARPRPDRGRRDPAVRSSVPRRLQRLLHECAGGLRRRCHRGERGNEGHACERRSPGRRKQPGAGPGPRDDHERAGQRRVGRHR